MEACIGTWNTREEGTNHSQDIYEKSYTPGRVFKVVELTGGA